MGCSSGKLFIIPGPSAFAHLDQIVFQFLQCGKYWRYGGSFAHSLVHLEMCTVLILVRAVIFWVWGFPVVFLIVGVFLLCSCAIQQIGMGSGDPLGIALIPFGQSIFEILVVHRQIIVTPWILSLWMFPVCWYFSDFASHKICN